MRSEAREKQNQSRRNRYLVDPEYRQKMVLRSRIRWLSTHWRSIIEPKPLKTNAEKCREYYYRHHENRKSHQRAYYKTHREDALSFQRKYAEKHRAKISERARARRMANIDAVRKYDRERSKKGTLNPSVRERRRNYYQLVAKRFMDIKRRKELREAKVAFGNCCCQCGWSEIPELLEFDHVVPPIKRGRNRHWTDRNIVAARYPERFRLVCPICHAIKSSLWKRCYPATKVALKLRETRIKKLSALGGHCVNCGYDECNLAIQIDHVAPIFRKRQGTGTPSLKEIRLHPEKYQTLCAICHKLKSIIELFNLIPEVFWASREAGHLIDQEQPALLTS